MDVQFASFTRTKLYISNTLWPDPYINNWKCTSIPILSAKHFNVRLIAWLLWLEPVCMAFYFQSLSIWLFGSTFCHCQWMKEKKKWTSCCKGMAQGPLMTSHDFFDEGEMNSNQLDKTHRSSPSRFITVLIWKRTKKVKRRKAINLAEDEEKNFVVDVSWGSKFVLHFDLKTLRASLCFNEVLLAAGIFPSACYCREHFSGFRVEIFHGILRR